MAAKKPTKKAPAKAGALPLRRLTQQEKDAHDVTGAWWGPGLIPIEKTQAVLSHHQVSVDQMQSIIDDLVDPIGRYYMDAKLIEKRLTPTQIVEQGRMTAAIAHELAQRIKYMDPNLRAYAEGKALSAWSEPMASQDDEEFLTRLAVLMNITAAEIDARARKTVTKRTGPRDRLLAEGAEVVRRHSSFGKQRAREVAADLLRAWSIQAPENPRKHRKAVNRPK